MKIFFTMMLMGCCIVAYGAQSQPTLPFMLTTPDQYNAWVNISHYKDEADQRVAQAIKDVSQKAEELEAIKRELEASEQRFAQESQAASQAHQAMITELTKKYEAEKRHMVRAMGEQSRSASMRRLSAVGIGICASLGIASYQISYARKKIAAITNALHQDAMINWRHEMPLTAIKKISEAELSKQLIAAYFSSPEVIRKTSVATPIDRVIKAIHDRIDQVQLFLSWGQSNALIRWLVGIDIRMLPVAQERLARLIIIRDALMNYKS